MKQFARFSRIVGITTFVTAVTHLPALAECLSLTQRFDRAVAEKSIEAAKNAAEDIASDIVCGERAEEFKGRYVRFLIALGEGPTTAPAERERALLAAEAAVLVTGTWRQAAALGDAYFRRGDRPRAFQWYERSVAFLATRPAAGATREERQALASKAGAAKAGASGTPRGRELWQPSTRELDGKVAGIYSPTLIREVEIVSVPLPVQFHTDEARFTSEGEAAVAELAAAAEEQNLQTLKLVGHADPRGTAVHNMDLSRRRVEAVRAELLRRGVHARITIDWKGSQQPFDVKVLPYRPTQEETWAYDRRVEWVREGVSK
jgi:outer membrane protein OmpA-like peptidoglycan-associated protein